MSNTYQSKRVAIRKAHEFADREKKTYIVQVLCNHMAHDEPDEIYAIIAFDDWIEMCIKAGAPISHVYCARN